MSDVSIIEHWRIHHLTFDQKDIDKVYPGKGCKPLIFTGTVVEDVKGRWVKGDHMRSSLITFYDKETGLVKTVNSIYKLSGKDDDILPDMKNGVLNIFY